MGADASPTPTAAAEELLAALGARVKDPLRDPKYDTARIRIANAAVLPSRVWKDTAIWSTSTPNTRLLLIHGRPLGNRYFLEAVDSILPPARSAESRHIINLTRLGADEYVWDTEVDYATGAVTAAQAARFVGAMFATAEGRDERVIRADYASSIPRASAVLGQLFAVDSIRTMHLADSSTFAAFHLRLDARGIDKKYPSFAKYMRRYGETTRAHWTLTDRLGTSYFDLTVRDARLVMRVRTRNGRLVALAGQARELPDSTTLNIDLTFKVRAFTVGMRNYRGEFTIIREDGVRFWSLVSKREPEWVLPLITERLLRTPLRRPFHGNGASFTIGLRDSTAGPTVLRRRLHLEVQESAILRFIGRLGATAVNDFTGEAEREQYQWLEEFFTGLLADVQDLGRTRANRGAGQ